MEPELCSHCKGVNAKDLPVACTLLEGGPCPACKEEVDIRYQIKQLEEEIIKLREKHHVLQTMINMVHDLFIHKFPPEISSYILCLCLPTLDLGNLCPGPNQQEVNGALRLGAVCQKWHQLAWVMLYVHIGQSTTHSLAKLLLGLIKEWLG